MEEYALGQDVSALAGGKTSKTAVLSVRLPIEEFAALDAVCRATGKTASQLVRDAIGSYLHSRLQSSVMFTMSSSSGTFSSGASIHSGKPVRGETWYVGSPNQA